MTITGTGSLLQETGRPNSMESNRDFTRALAQETELQKMLTDEKMRSEQHRTNYQTLKVEHTRLQDELLQIQGELRNAIEESKLMQEKYKALLEEENIDKSNLHAEIEDLKTRIVTPQRMDVIRLQVSEELDRQYRDRFSKLDQDVERHRAEYNKIRYEYSFLKSEYEHDKLENARIIEEMKLQNEAEVLNLRKERENLLGRQQSDMKQDTQKVRQLQRDNAQLHLKIKGLVSELDELRAQQEHKGLQTDQVTRLQVKQINEHASNLRSIQTERDALRLQCDNLMKELTSSSDTNIQLTNKIHQVEKENLVLKNRVEEVTHRGKIELSNMKMDLVKQKGELGRQVDRLTADLEDVQSALELSKHSLEQQAASLVEKERETVRRVQIAREEEWEKLTKVEDERLELETRLQELERRRLTEEAERHASRERINERIRVTEDLREAAEKETITLRAKLDQQQSVMDQLESERQQNAGLKSQLHQLETEMTNTVNGEQEIVTENYQLRTNLVEAQAEVRRLSDIVNKDKNSVDTILAQQKAIWLEEKANVSRRIQELESVNSTLSSKYTQATTIHKKRKKRYVTYTRELKDKYQLLKAKYEHLQLENKGANKADPNNAEFTKLKRQYRDLCRRHEEFRNIILVGNPTDSSSTKARAGGDQQADLGPGSLDNMGIVDFNEQERQHQNDLTMIQRRLSDLQSSQQQQMKDLRMLDAPEDKVD